MNGRERIALAMRHREPDRAPVTCQLSIGHYNLNGGYKPLQVWYETEALADALLRRRHAGQPARVAGSAGLDPPGATGIMYTTWQNKYELLAPFGDLVSKERE